MGVYNDLFFDALEKIEAVQKERTFVELNMARVFLNAALGDDWISKRINFNDKPDAFMLNGNDAWLRANPVPSPDMRRILYTSRVIRLSDALFTLIPKTTGFERLRRRFHKRKDTHALFGEALIASFLVRNGLPVQIVGKSGKRGEDFDFLTTVRGVPVSVEVSAFQSSKLSVRAILNKLNDKKTKYRQADQLFFISSFQIRGWQTITLHS